MHRYILACIFLLSAIVSSAKDEFTQQEQQQISVETPGLFSQSNAFQVDFAHLPKTDYSFPLPVGKTTAVTATAVEIETKTGDAVKAMFGGVVRLATKTAWGQTVVIRHDNGLETVYGNNDHNTVKVGQRVKAGQTIAIVGTKDDKTYCEFAIMVNGARLNPETLIDINSHRLRRQTLLFEKQDHGVRTRVLTEETQQQVAKKNRNDRPAGNMNPDANRKKTTQTASERHAQGTETTAVRQEDENNAPDLDEFQSMQLETTVKSTFPAGNEFTINFASYKASEWCYPLPGAKVISPFGGKRRHAGTDLKTRPNDEIKAAFDGEVTLSGTHYGYGLCIVIKHANGLETLYSHQSKNLVKVGEWVKAGQTIGLVGRTGRATTEHCHFEVRCGGRPFDSSKIYDHAKHIIRPNTFVFRKNGVRVSISPTPTLPLKGRE